MKTDLFVLCNIRFTKGHNLKLYRLQCNLNMRKYSFAYRVTDIWNSLLTDNVIATSISVFKQKLESVDLWIS